MPKIFSSDLLIDDYDPFLISASIENLCRLGLLVHYDNGISTENYDVLKDHWYVKKDLIYLKIIIQIKLLN